MGRTLKMNNCYYGSTHRIYDCPCRHQVRMKSVRPSIEREPPLCGPKGGVASTQEYLDCLGKTSLLALTRKSPAGICWRECLCTYGQRYIFCRLCCVMFVYNCWFVVKLLKKDLVLVHLV